MLFFLGLYWHTVDMSVSLASEKLLEIQQLAYSLLERQPVTLNEVMSFLGKTTFCANGHAQFYHLCCVIQSVMLNVYHSPAHLFFHFTFLFKHCIRLGNSLCRIVFSPFVLASSSCVYHNRCYTIHWDFIFWVLDFLYPVVEPGLGLWVRFLLPCKNSRLLH